jgi:hypothetical protein
LLCDEHLPADHPLAFCTGGAYEIPEALTARSMMAQRKPLVTSGTGPSLITTPRWLQFGHISRRQCGQSSTVSAYMTRRFSLIF